MIVDREERFVLDHVGWGDQYADVWRYRVDNGEIDELRLGEGASYFRPAFDGEHLLASSRLADGTHSFTIRPIVSVTTVVAAATWRDGSWQFTGNETLWSRTPRYARVWLPERESSVLLHIDPDDPTPDPLDWYNNEHYDLGWQGLLDAYEIPGSSLIVVAVQRDSRPVIYDPRSRTVVGHLRLADRGGNPSLYFRRFATELWVDDYDTLVRLQPETREQLGSLRLQTVEGPMYQEPIGTFWFPYDERFCVVARPMSGDVVVLDPVRFEVTGSVHLGMQPLSAVILANGTVLARDWQSRRLLSAWYDESRNARGRHRRGWPFGRRRGS